MSEKAKIVMNEQHTLLSDQTRVLDEHFPGGWSLLPVPADGWTLAEMRKIASRICVGNVVFASPVPALLAMLARESGWRSGIKDQISLEPLRVWVLHNDNRVAKELPGGKIVHTVSPDGWVLV